MKDYVIKATSGNGEIRAYVGNTREMVEQARVNHNTTKVATAALGRTLTATSMMGLMMKNEKDELTVIIKGGGPIGTILATSDAKGMVRGYVQNPDVQVENYKRLRIKRALYRIISVSKWRNSRRLHTLLCFIRTNSFSSFARCFN